MRKPIIASIAILVVWCIYSIVVATTPYSVPRIIDTSVDSKTFQHFYARETADDGTVFRWIARPVVQMIAKTRYQYVFVALSGVAPTDNTAFVFTLDEANPQTIPIRGINAGFRTYHLAFLPTQPIINVENNLRFSINTTAKRLPVIDNRKLMLAVSTITINTVANDIPSLLIESALLLILVGLLVVIIDWRRHPWIYALILTCGVGLHMWGHHQFWGFGWHWPMWGASIFVAFLCSRYWILLYEWAQRTWVRVISLIPPALLTTRSYVISIMLLAAVYTSLTSQYIVDIWAWSTTEMPVILIIVQMVSIAIIVCIAYGLLRIRRLPRILLIVCIAHMLLHASLYTMYTPGCMVNDSFNNALVVKNGWFEDGYSRMLYILLYAFVQIMPWEWHAPLFFLQLLWVIALFLVHRNLYQLTVPTWVHGSVFAIYAFPTFLVASLNVTRDGFFTVFASILLLVSFWVFTTKRYSVSYLLILGGLIAIVTGLRSDALPFTGLLTFAVIYVIWRTNQQMRQRLTRVSMLILPIIGVFVYVSLIPLFLKHVPFGEHKDSALRGHTYIVISNDMYTTLSVETSVSWFVNMAPEVIPSDTINLINQMYPNDVLKTNFYPFSPRLTIVYGQYDTLSDETNATYMQKMAQLFISNPFIYLDAKYHMSRAMQFNLMWTNCSPGELTKNGYNRIELPRSIQQIRNAIFTNYIRPTLVPASAWHELTGQPDTITYSQFTGDRTNRPVRIFQQMPYGHWWNVDYYFILCIIMILTIRIAPISALFAGLILIRGLTMFLLSPVATPGYQFLLYVMTPIMTLLWLIELHRWYIHRHQPTT